MSAINLIEALIRVNKTKSNNTYPPIEQVCESLGVSQYYELESLYYQDEDAFLLASYPVMQWNCTDTRVGLNALYFEDELVGMSWQSARKSYIEIKWISLDAAEKVRSYLISKTGPGQIDLIDPAAEIQEFFTVSASASLSDDGFYDNRPARALVWYDWYRHTTPVEYRRDNRSYCIRVPYDSAEKDRVMIEMIDTKERLTVSTNDFVKRININEPLS